MVFKFFTWLQIVALLVILVQLLMGAFFWFKFQLIDAYEVKHRLLARIRPLLLAGVVAFVICPAVKFLVSFATGFIWFS